MIYIKETLLSEKSVTVQVDGNIDVESIQILNDVCEHHLRNRKEIFLDLERVSDICRNGRDFLKEIFDRGVKINFPQFLRFNDIHRGRP